MNSENNKRIAKNTLMLYFRMILIMLVSFYTVRVVLSTLGKEDYGIYNVVAGVVVMLSFFNNSLSVTTQRFLNYEMGKDDSSKNLSKIFSISLTIHYIIAFIIFIVAETIGLWFVNNKLIIPPDRLNAALWVYQFSILTVIVNVISVPYNAAIIANERMAIYAYVSIIEVVLKLLTVFLLSFFLYDKLKLYGILLFAVSLIIRVVYLIYCKKNFLWCKFRFIWDKQLLKQMLNFSGWTIVGSSAQMLSNQGVNVLINIFFTPIHNTAVAIATQVQSAVKVFYANFMTAVRPQIVKSFSQKEYDYVYKLTFGSSKYSFYLLFIISLPILLNTNYILTLWLKNVPEYTLLFVRLAIIEVLINSLISPLASLSQASGKVRNYQIIIAVCYFLVFIITAILYNLKFDAYITFVIAILMAVVGLIARTIELKFAMSFPIKKFLVDVCLRVVLVVLVALFIPLLLYYNTSIYQDNFMNLILVVLITTFSSLFSIWFIGLNKQEKKIILNKLFHK